MDESALLMAIARGQKPQATMEQLAEAAAAAEELERRKKRLKVSRACVRCKQAKTCCDEQRPCRRCVRLGVESECVDAEQRKPGRKRKVAPDDDAVAAADGTAAVAVAAAAVRAGTTGASLVASGGPAGSAAHSAGAGSAASADPAGTPPPPSPLATPSTPQFVQPPPRPPLVHSSGSLPRILDLAEMGTVFAGPPMAQSFDRKHPLYITPDTLPNPERPDMRGGGASTFVSAALSMAARAGEQFAQSIGAGSGHASGGPAGLLLGSDPSTAAFAALTSVASAAARSLSPSGSGSPDPASGQPAAEASRHTATPRPPLPSMVMQSAYYALFECLAALRRQLEAGRAAIHAPLLRFLSLHLLNKAPAYGIPADVIAAHARQLGVDDAPRVRLVPDGGWLRAMAQACGAAPVGVLGVRFTAGCIDSIFVNDEACRLLGYSAPELRRMVLDPTDQLFLRVWHWDDWRRMFLMSFVALVQRQPRVSTRLRVFHSSGASFDAVWSVALTFGDDGTPSSQVIYITPTEHPSHDLPAVAVHADADSAPSSPV